MTVVPGPVTVVATGAMLVVAVTVRPAPVTVVTNGDGSRVEVTIEMDTLIWELLVWWTVLTGTMPLSKLEVLPWLVLTGSMPLSTLELPCAMTVIWLAKSEVLNRHTTTQSPALTKYDGIVGGRGTEFR